MTTVKRIENIIIGVVIIAMAVTMVSNMENGYKYVLSMLSFSMTFSALKTLFYYFTMTRFMVGGKTALYKGVILLDFAFIASTLYDLPSYYVLIYLIVIHAFTCVVEFLRANEAGKYGSKSWRSKLLNGIVNLIIIIACIISINDTNTAVWIYSLGLFYSGLVRIISSFRKSTLVYIL